MLLIWWFSAVIAQGALTGHKWSFSIIQRKLNSFSFEFFNRKAVSLFDIEFDIQKFGQ